MQKDGSAGQPRPPWYLITSHGMVLVYIATHPHETIREISDSLGLTQRRVVAVVKDLADSGLLEVERHGRRNRYRIIEEAPFLHPALSHIKVADFVALMRGTDK